MKFAIIFNAFSVILNIIFAFSGFLTPIYFIGLFACNIASFTMLFMVSKMRKENRELKVASVQSS